MATLALLSAAVALLLSFLIANQASQFGFAVAVRFLERGSVIPPDNDPLTAENLDRWRSDPANRAAAQGYASRLMPLDIVFLLSLGCFFGFASATLAGHAGMSTSYLVWPWIAPALYMASDLIEDLLIRNVLLSPAPPARNFVQMRRATGAKMVTSMICFLQVFVLTFRSLWSMPG